MPTGAAAATSSRNDFLCGWGAGCIETCITFPLGKLTFRQQLHGVVLKEALSQLFTEGIPLLYRGLLPPLIQRTSSRMIMFGMFEAYKKMLGCSDTGASMSSTLTLCHAYSAFLAGATEALLCPLERVQVLLQTAAYHKQFRNSSEAFAAVRRHGLKEFYRGFSLIVMRNGLSNSIFFPVREPLKMTVLYAISAWEKEEDVVADNPMEPKSKVVIHTFAEFASGAVLGASISTLFFPLAVVKQRMQSALGTPFLSPLAVFQTVWRERNRSVRELYRGVHLNFTRSLLTWGITSSSYEILKKLVW